MPILVRERTDKVGRQLDYVLVSTRWKSNITDCKPQWKHAMHRDKYGERNDHALLECCWKWRIRVNKSTPCKDFEALYDTPTDENGDPIENVVRTKFDEALDTKLAELNYDHNVDNTTEMYDKICLAIHHAIDTALPSKPKTPGIHYTF